MSLTFAWVDASETSFGAEHHRVDEDVCEFLLAHAEGEFATFRCTIRNPRVGLLAAGRKRWAWVGWQDGATVTALFFGRLVGVPQNLFAEAIELEFVARPDDFDAQKRALAETLKVGPYWDPVWFDEAARDNPDSVLEARRQRWHIDRVTHAVTVSDVVTGEDGTVAVGGGFFRDSLAVGYGQLPGRRVELTADVYWQQQAVGSVDLKDTFLKAAAAAGSERKGLIETYTGEGLADDWPEEGEPIGAGWSWGDCAVERAEGSWVRRSWASTTVFNAWTVEFPLWSLKPTINASYDVERSYQERVTFTLEADVQPLVTEPGDEEVIEIAIASRQVGEPVDPALSTGGEGETPLDDLRRRRYFATDRGKESLDYLIALAVAHLVHRARAIDVSFEMPFEDGLSLSCRQSASITDARLPGGAATGKIVAYELFMNADTGEKVCRVSIACSIGRGGSVTAVAGTPVYVEEGVLEAGIQAYEGASVQVGSIEVTYDGDDLIYEPNDDGIDFFNLTADDALNGDNTFAGLEMINGKAEQEALIASLNSLTTWSGDESAPRDPQEAVRILNEAYSQFHGALTPLTGGPFLTEIAVTVADVKIAKTIDLEAA